MYPTADLVAQYLGECEVRGLSPSTINQRRWALTRLTDNCPVLPCGVMDLIPIFGDSGLALESRRDLHRCVKSFFGWATRRHQLANPCEELDRMPRSRNLPRVLTTNEVDQLMAAAAVEYWRCEWHRERDRALLLVVLDCGLRVGEVAGLRRGNLRDGWVIVDGKTGVRQVPISDALRVTLANLGRGDHVWMGSRGPLTKAGVQQVYKRLFARAGVVGPKAGPHALRHTFATFYLRSGGGVRQLQDILGHQKLETTMIYVHLAGNDVQADHARHSPVKTLGLMEPAQEGR